jgi:hypothetical protein
MSPKDEDFIRFYRDAVIAGHNEPAAETMRHFNLSRDYIVRLLNETIAGCEGQDIPIGSPKNNEFATCCAIGHKESPALAGLSVRRNVEPENRICGYMIDREQASSAVALTV